MTSDDQLKALLDAIDDDKCVEGYQAGREGWPPNQGACGSWMHGWRNGRVDGGHDKASSFQRSVSEFVLRTGYLRFDEPEKREVEA